MTKIIAISPSGVAYECDTPGEARKVTHGGKRNPSSGKLRESRWMQVSAFQDREKICDAVRFVLPLIGDACPPWTRWANGWLNLSISPSVPSSFAKTSAEMLAKSAYKEPNRSIAWAAYSVAAWADAMEDAMNAESHNAVMADNWKSRLKDVNKVLHR